MSVTRVVKLVFMLEDKLSEPLKRVALRTDKVLKKIEDTAKSLKKLGSNAYSVGRRITFMGFVASAAARRMFGAFESVANLFISLSKEGANVGNAMNWLGEKIEGLALSGQLTGDNLGELMDVWTTMLENSYLLRGEFDELDIKMQDLKNSVTTNAIDAFSSLNDKIDELDWDTVKTGVDAIAAAFVGPLKDAIDTFVTDENVATILDNLESLATFAGGFAQGLIDAGFEILSFVGYLDENLGDDDTGIKGFGVTLGNIAAALGLFAVPAILIGGTASMLGVAFTEVGLIVAALMIPLITDTDSWISLWEDKLNPALDDLGDLIGGEGSGLVAIFDAFGAGVTIIVTGLVVAFQTLIDLLTELKALLGSGVAGSVPSGLTSAEGIPLGIIPDYLKENGKYDPYKIPGRAFGGRINQSGLYRLHRGETIINPTQSRNMTMGNITINVNGSGDPRATAQAINRELGKIARRNLLNP